MFPRSFKNLSEGTFKETKDRVSLKEIYNKGKINGIFGSDGNH